MGFRGVGIIIWKDKAYLPSLAEYKTGIIVHVEPVYVTELSISGLVVAIKKVLSSERKLLSDPTADEWKNRKDPILAKTGARSWQELALDGASLGIEWVPQGIRLDVSRVDKEGRWEIDPSKVRILSPNTSFEEIAKEIIEKVNKAM